MSFRQRRPLARAAIAGVVLGPLVLLGGPAWTGSLVSAAGFSVRLEAGPQTGYRFSPTGTILGRKTVTMAAPATASADSRSSVPNQAGDVLPHHGRAVRRLSHPRIVDRLRPREGWRGDLEPDAHDQLRGRSLPRLHVRQRRRPGDDQARFQQHIVQRHGVPAGDHRRAAVRPHEQWLVDRLLDADRHGWVHDSPADHLLVPAKVAPGSAATYTRVATTDAQIALTFDMGGRMTPAMDVMERLIVDRVCATVFPTGDAAPRPRAAR